MRIGVLRIWRSIGAEKALLFRVGIHQRDRIVAAIGELQIGERLRIHREEAHCGPVFRRHVGDGRAVGKAQRAQTLAVKFNELAHYALLAQHLRNGEDQVGRRAAFVQFAVQLEANHRRQQHGNGLAEHAGFGFDPAHAPAEHAESVDHGGVRIGSNQRIGVCLSIPAEYHRCQVFEVHLVHDARIGRHHAEIAERGLAPAQQHVALAVALEFEQCVKSKRILRAELIHLHGVIDHQIGGHQRIGAAWVSAHGRECIAHCSEIDHAGHAGEILQQHARRHEADLFGLAARRRAGHIADVVRRNALAVFIP